MTQDDEQYDLGTIHDLLVAAFSAYDLRRLIRHSDNLELRSADNEFSPDDSTARLADKVIQYCQKRRLLAHLLAEVKAARPRWWEDFECRIYRLEAEHRSPLSPPGSAPYQAPCSPAEFVGRETELVKLDTILKPGTTTAITGVVGMGGVGKTELVKVMADRVAHRFHDGVLWADCEEQGLMTIADLWAAEYDFQLPGDGEAAKAAAWRSLISDKEALLIFDNVQPRQEIEPLFPPRGQSAVLITSRHGNHPALHDAERLSLDQFTLEEAMALAEEILGQREACRQATEAERLFELVGYLPLAVSIALHLACECRWELDYLGQKLEAAGALAVLRDQENLRKSLNATFETAWKNLINDLRKTFGVLAVFNEGPDFSTQALADTLRLEEPEAGARLRRLAGRSLLKEEGEGRWSLHPLLREFADNKAAVDEGVRAGMARHYVGVAREAQDLYLRGGEGVLRGLSLFDREWPHIRAGQAWAARGVDESDEAAQLCSEYARAAISCLDLRLHAREQIGWFELAVHAACKQEDQSAEGGHLRSLGNAYIDLGETQRAIECYEQALEISREIGDRRSEGNSLGNLGNAYFFLSDAQRAIKYQEQALEIAHEIGDHRGEGRHLGNLGLAYAYLGETRRAIEYYKQALEIHREIGDRRSVGAHLGNLGEAYTDLGETRQAIEYHKQALEIAREMGDRLFEGLHLANLGEAYTDLGDTARVRDLLTEALHIFEAIECPYAEQMRDLLATLEEQSVERGTTLRATT